MSIPSKQIGWSNESNLLWQISKQLEQLTGVTSKIVTSTSTYNVYTALVTWDDTGLTDLNVLENTLGGDLDFSINTSNSQATITSTDLLFTTNKTFVLLNSFWDAVDQQGVGTACKINSTSELIASFDGYGNAAIFANPRTGFIEIRVYN